MKIEDIKEYIDKNRELFPLSFYDAVYTPNDDVEKAGKIVYSEKFKDSGYSIFKFYKPIARY